MRIAFKLFFLLLVVVFGEFFYMQLFYFFCLTHLQVTIHEDFIQSCFDRLKASYDMLCVLDSDKDNISCTRQEAIQMVRVLTVLREYISECDSDYHGERIILPLSRFVKLNLRVTCN